MTDHPMGPKGVDQLAYLNLRLILEESRGFPTGPDKRDALYMAAALAPHASLLPAHMVDFIQRMLTEHAGDQPGGKTANRPRKTFYYDAVRLECLMIRTGRKKSPCAELLAEYMAGLVSDPPEVSALKKNYDRRPRIIFDDEMRERIVQGEPTGDPYVDDLIEWEKLRSSKS